jgi:polysaccharide deacetylase 2 family uncharacterized protein YibQ
MSEKAADAKKKARLAAEQAKSFLLTRPLLSGFLSAFLGVIIILAALPVSTIPDTDTIVEITAPLTTDIKEPEKAKSGKLAYEAHSPLDHKEVAEIKATPPSTAPEEKAETEKKPVIKEAAITDKNIVTEMALLITDTGLNRRLTETFLSALPKETSFAVSVYATNPELVTANLKKTGHDIWMQISAQSTKPGIDPGPLALSSRLSTTGNIEMLKKQLNIAGQNAIGIYVPDDAEITQQSDVWRNVALEAIASDKIIMDGTKTQIPTELYIQKSETKITAYLKTGLTINAAIPATTLKQTLDKATAEILKSREIILVIKNPTLASSIQIKDWLKTLPAKGIHLVPASKFTGLSAQ